MLSTKPRVLLKSEACGSERSWSLQCCMSHAHTPPTSRERGATIRHDDHSLLLPSSGHEELDDCVGFTPSWRTQRADLQVVAKSFVEPARRRWQLQRFKQLVRRCPWYRPGGADPSASSSPQQAADHPDWYSICHRGQRIYFLNRLFSVCWSQWTEHLCKAALPVPEPNAADSNRPLTSGGSRVRRPTAVVVFAARPLPFSPRILVQELLEELHVLVFIIFFFLHWHQPIESRDAGAVMKPRPSAATCRLARSIAASREPPRRPCPIMVAADIGRVAQLRWRHSRRMRRRGVARDCRA